MDTAKLILTQPVLPPAPLGHSDGLDNISEQRKKQVAKDFESILTYKILSEMDNTIGDWGFEKEGASKQVQSLFSFYLCDHIAKNGGLGLWKEIYESLASSVR
jgi:Rod binding domain-containing protein